MINNTERIFFKHSEIKYKDGDLVLSKSTSEWRAVSPYDYSVNSALVEKAVSALKNFKLESIISTNPAKKETFGFKDSLQAEISVYEGGVLKGKFILGGPSAGSSSHVKKVDSDNIYIADVLDRMDFIKPSIDEWRDKNIVAIPKQSVNSIDFISSGETFSVKKDPNGKFFIGQDSVLSTTFDGILNLLQKFETNGFKDTTIADDAGFSNQLIIDWGNKTQMRFLKTDTEPVKYYLKVDGDKQIYELEEGYAKNLLKTKKDLTGK